MALKDEELTTFRTTKKTYCYNVKPLGLKNVGVTYQGAMTIIFEDIFHEVVECFVDDLVFKSRDRSTHLTDLETMFKKLRRHLLKMNPLNYAFRKAIKGQALVGFFAAHPLLEGSPLNEGLLDEEVMCTNELDPWQMFFDGASHPEGTEAGMIFVTQDKGLFPYVFSLNEKYSNNEAECQVLIIGLDMALQLDSGLLNIFNDFHLIVYHLKEIYKVCKDELKTLTYIHRGSNVQAYALAKVGAIMTIEPRIFLHVPI
ncbi:uncharacterized protein LOC105420731 [Amborella trichopoda]|uniref:uncharacterized protein LOC105420731 n=1 Tax=Amborella trichopoda TaxID=13333 RepID=UPI0005D39D22|nr:uncharacterized protein LOC105420731 [Amborella trichopoda]|eukprot:XP_011623758.1 uncharacterized protein LOC105420731 [Amborella trichopoda]